MCPTGKIHVSEGRILPPGATGPNGRGPLGRSLRRGHGGGGPGRGRADGAHREPPYREQPMAVKILIVTGDAAESLEVLYPYQRLREEGYEVHIAAPAVKKLRFV